jgi:ABC-2 type transport system permease protein
MNGMRQGWLVARREIRERSRSKVFRIGIVITLALVVTAIVMAAKIHTGTVTRDVGFTGTTRAALPAAVIGQGKAVDVTVRPRYYGGVAAGEQAVRAKTIAVLVVDAHTLTWRGQPDEQLRAIVTGAIQAVTVQQRAAAAGIDPGQLHAVLAPVPVQNQQLDVTAGRMTTQQPPSS